MTSGARLAHGNALAALCACWMLWLCAHTAASEKPDAALTQLMARMQSVPTSSAKFVEQKFLAILKTPVESSGTLSYTAPSRLERNTLEPAHTRMIVEGDQITIEEADGKVRTLSLEQSPEIAAIIESIRGALSGDLEVLKRYYTVSFESGEPEWTLTLIPKKTRLKAVIKSIRIAGSEASIRRVETEEKNGDRTIMTITEDVR